MHHTYANSKTSMHDILPETFAIVHLEDLPETTTAEAAKIHRHKTFEIIFLSEGAAICRVDTQSYRLAPANISVIRPGQLHTIELTRHAKGYELSFSPEFFPVSLERSLLLNTSALFTGAGGQPIEVAGPLQTEMIRLMQLMHREYTNAGLFKAEALRGLLKIFFIYLSRLISKEPPVRLNRKNQIVEHFLAMLDEKFTTLRRPADYAHALAVTTNYLNETLKTVSGFTTSYHIHQRVILEAKRLAVYGDHSMKQVASTLGFDDVCHFSRFFKKASGQGFTEFKQKTLIGVM
jgi:AraC family transcriptional activator of pobA